MKIHDIILERDDRYPDGDRNDPKASVSPDITPYINYVQDLQAAGVQTDPQAVAKGLQFYAQGRLSPDEAYDSAKRRIDVLKAAGRYDSIEARRQRAKERDDFRSAIESMRSKMEQPGKQQSQDYANYSNLNTRGQRQVGWNDDTHGHLRKRFQTDKGVSVYDNLKKLADFVTLDNRGPIPFITHGFRRGGSIIDRLKGKTK